MCGVFYPKSGVFLGFCVVFWVGVFGLWGGVFGPWCSGHTGLGEVSSLDWGLCSCRRGKKESLSKEEKKAFKASPLREILVWNSMNTDSITALI